MRRGAAVLLGALALGPAACGGQSPSSPSGKVVFAHECQFCHSLSGHSTPRQQGGDLLHVALPRAPLIRSTAEMPVRHKLSRAELRAVVDYVLAVQRAQS